MNLYNFHLKHLKPLRHVSIFSDHHQGVSSFLAKVMPCSIRSTPSQLHSLQHIPTQHDMLPQHLVYKNELNCEYVITLARNDETPWWWSEKIETCQSGFKCFKWKLYRCICWLIVEANDPHLSCNCLSFVCLHTLTKITRQYRTNNCNERIMRQYLICGDNINPLASNIRYSHHIMWGSKSWTSGTADGHLTLWPWNWTCTV